MDCNRINAIKALDPFDLNEFRPAMFVSREFYSLVKLFNLDIHYFEDDLLNGDRCYLEVIWNSNLYLCTIEKYHKFDIFGFEFWCKSENITEFRKDIIDIFYLDIFDFDYTNFSGSEVM